MVLDLADDDIIVSIEKLRDCLNQRNIQLIGQPLTANGSRLTVDSSQPSAVSRQPSAAPPPETSGPPRPVIVTGCKADVEGASERQAIAAEMLGAEFPILALSTATHAGLEELRTLIFKRLHVIRVYTKKPGHPPDMNEPVIVPEGSTVMAAAQHLHKDFAAQLRYAKYWDNDKFSGQMVDRTHVLSDKSIVEFHI
jgi:hypothetical protein